MTACLYVLALHNKPEVIILLVCDPDIRGGSLGSMKSHDNQQGPLYSDKLSSYSQT